MCTKKKIESSTTNKEIDNETKKMPQIHSPNTQMTQDEDTASEEDGWNLPLGFQLLIQPIPSKAKDNSL